MDYLPPPIHLSRLSMQWHRIQPMSIRIIIELDLLYSKSIELSFIQLSVFAPGHRSLRVHKIAHSNISNGKIIYRNITWRKRSPRKKTILVWPEWAVAKESKGRSTVRYQARNRKEQEFQEQTENGRVHAFIESSCGRAVLLLQKPRISRSKSESLYGLVM